MTSHRVVQPTPRRVVAGIAPIPGVVPHRPHQHHDRTGHVRRGTPSHGPRRRRCAGPDSVLDGPRPVEDGVGGRRRRRTTAAGQRVTGEDGTLTSIVAPGCVSRIFTSSALRGPLWAPPHTTVLRFSPFALTVKDTWSAADTEIPETSARRSGASDPSAASAASTPALVTWAAPELTSGTPSGALPTVRKVNPSRSTTSTSPRGLRTASTATRGVTVTTTVSGRLRPTDTLLQDRPASSRAVTASVSTRINGPPSGTCATARTCPAAAGLTPWTSTLEAVRTLLNQPSQATSPTTSRTATRTPATRRGRRRAAAARRSNRVRDDASPVPATRRWAVPRSSITTSHL